MNHSTKNFVLVVCVGAAASAQAGVQLISNGGFESGFSGWTRINQIGSEGTYHDQTGTLSPINAFAVPAPPQGTHAAMTDSGGPGSHVLYQDFVVPAGVTQATASFSLFINNTADDFFVPATLDFATPTLNQQARVDIMTASSDPFSMGAADILQNLFQTSLGAPFVSGYDAFSVDVSALLAARAGQTLRLRFAQVDNVNIFNFGVDGVDIVIPSPATLFLGVPALLVMRRRR